MNPMRENPEKQIRFYDITNIYQNQKKAQTAECFGHHHLPQKIKKHIQTRFLCNHVIAPYCSGHTNLFAYVID